MMRSLAASLLFFAVCDPGDDSPGGVACEGEKCDGASSTLLTSATELVRCWLEPGTGPSPFLTVDGVHCQVSPPPPFFGRLVVKVSFRSRSGRELAGVLDLMPGVPQSLGVVAREDYPLAGSVEVYLDPPAEDGLRLPGDLTLTAPMAFATHEAPAITLETPFDVWWIEVGTTLPVAGLELDPVNLPLEPFTSPEGPALLNDDLALYPRPDQPRSAYVPVPRGTTTLSGKARVRFAEVAVHLYAPGRWVLDETGLHAAPVP